MTTQRFLKLLGIALLATLGFASVALATTITVIQGTDTLSASRTTFNNNFAALNNGKPELSGDIGGTSSTPRLSLTGQGTGTLAYFTAGLWRGLPTGTSGYVLTMSSTGTPTWASPAGGGTGSVSATGTAGEVFVFSGTYTGTSSRDFAFDTAAKLLSVGGQVSSTEQRTVSSTLGTLTVGSLNGVLKGTAGVVSAASAGSDYENPLTFSAPLSRSVNTVSLPAWDQKASSSLVNQAVNTTSSPTFAGVTASLYTYADGTTSTSQTAERCDIDFVIENGIASERDHARAFGSTSTLTRALAWNKGASDSMTFNIGITSAFNTATSSLSKMFSSDQTVATTTLTALTANGSTTVGALRGLLFLSSGATSTHFGVTICYK